jgi:serine-type D-Ala-D-Ala endopeptidase (penicillin-binding protein 7)
MLVVPARVLGLFMPQTGNDLAEMSGVAAASYIVADANSGWVLMTKNADQPRPPASLAKLVTALVVLDTKPKLSKTVGLTDQDQIAGSCASGGVCIKTKPGVKFTVDGLFHAALMPSANNAANALARSTGLPTLEFASRMNQKARELGATSSSFNEPTGLDPQNVITASDYAKILKAAFSNPYLRRIAGLQNYYLRSANNTRYNQTIKNNDRLLGDTDITILGAKTGYINESMYNFGALIRLDSGQELAVVVLGEDHLYTAFAETKLLAGLAEQAQALAFMNFQQGVLGTSTASVTISAKGGNN